ncbi:hypothetical protein Moror_16337 [Moniliophthora roreri MCA 2997]|uniref:DASH complex subunit DAD2 n=2 Tax=Moniliophthora roreri TaxID=221103 RepID=V2XBC8_MONRO|nr:hypothetical protein Moror_16337 [Moniliophthora roreri MCA 2997]KAI3596971.1 hypothetical protein WG66_006361 [Moniliophthora roreri]
MRPSAIGNRSSYAPGLSSQTSSAATLAKLLEKKKEYEGVAALDKTSTLFLERITGLMEDTDVMANAGEALGMVLEQWPKMFQILNLYLSTRTDTTDGTDHATENGQMLIRIPIEELQQSTGNEVHE